MGIRPMRKEEADDISRIYAASWKIAYKGIVPQTYLDQLCELRWSPILVEKTLKSFVFLDKGHYIGTSSISPARDKKMAGWGEVISLYLLPEYFGKGYGRTLLDFCLVELKNSGFGRIYLWTLEKNERARAFYEKYGFECDGEKLVCNIGGENLTEIRYVLYFE